MRMKTMSVVLKKTLTGLDVFSLADGRRIVGNICPSTEVLYQVDLHETRHAKV